MRYQSSPGTVHIVCVDEPPRVFAIDPMGRNDRLSCPWGGPCNASRADGISASTTHHHHDQDIVHRTKLNTRSTAASSNRRSLQTGYHTRGIVSSTSPPMHLVLSDTVSAFCLAEHGRPVVPSSFPFELLLRHQFEQCVSRRAHRSLQFLEAVVDG